jgi:hypothetical protein
VKVPEWEKQGDIGLDPAARICQIQGGVVTYQHQGERSGKPPSETFADGNFCNDLIPGTATYSLSGDDMIPVATGGPERGEPVYLNVVPQYLRGEILPLVQRFRAARNSMRIFSGNSFP